MILSLFSIGRQAVMTLLFSVLALFVVTAQAQANVGTFSTPRFVQAGSWAAGAEPVVNLTGGTGVGANLRFTYGLNELNNVTAIVGGSTGGRGFRAGGNYTFDFFPDLEGQPGIGLALQSIYYFQGGTGLLDILGIPYVHKTFKSGKAEFEPYLGIPLGIALSAGSYVFTAAANVGAIVKGTENFRFILELGVALANTDTYISGGAVYYY